MTDPHDLIISQIYEAAAGLLPWPVALTSLSQAFGAMVVQYVSFDKETRQLILCEQPEGMVVDAVLDYIREYGDVDPHAERMKALPIGTCFASEDVFSARQMVTNRFYRDFWAPYEVRGMIAGKIDEGEQHYSCIGIVRHKSSPRFDATELALAVRYVHHFATALKVARHSRALQVTSRVGVHLMTTADRPMILLDRQRRVLFANAAGRALLSDGDVLTERRGRLHARSVTNDRALTKSLERLTTTIEDDRDDASGAPRAALRLDDRSTSAVLCTLWRLDPGRQSAFGDDTTVLLSIAHPIAGQPPDVHFVAAMLDLTPAEARLASLLATGQDLTEIAGLLGVSINTVRTQLRAIYAKTGTSRQAELVRLISRACAS